MSSSQRFDVADSTERLMVDAIINRDQERIRLLFETNPDMEVWNSLLLRVIPICPVEIVELLLDLGCNMDGAAILKEMEQQRQRITERYTDKDDAVRDRLLERNSAMIKMFKRRKGAIE